MNGMEQDHYYMQMAIEEAEKAAAKGEVPIGAVIVHQGRSDCACAQFKGNQPERRHPRRALGDTGSLPEAGQLAFGRYKPLRNVRALPDVCRCDSAIAHPACHLRRTRFQSRLCRFPLPVIERRTLQPSMRSHRKRAGRRMRRFADTIFPGDPGKQKEEKAAAIKPLFLLLTSFRSAD